MDTPPTAATPDSHQAPPTKPEPEVREIHYHHHHDRPRWGVGRLLFGIIMIYLGCSWLASASGWNWWPALDIARLWPLLIVALGLSILFRGRVWGTAIVVIIILGFAMMFAMMPWHSSTQFDRTIAIDKSATATAAALHLKTGATNLDIAGGSAQLVSGRYESSFADLHQSNDTSGPIQEVTLEPDSQWAWWHFGGGRNQTTLALTNDLPLSVTLDGGAMHGTLDFSATKLNALDINAGASTFDIHLGDLVDHSTVSIDSGASKITIRLPKTLGAQVRLNGGAITKTLPDLTRVNEHLYQTSNFAQAAKSATIDINAGASTIAVEWK